MMEFPEAKLYEEGARNVDDEIDKMREAILKKDGIVGPEAKNDFNYFVNNCMTKNMMEQIGGEISTYNNNSFRLKALNRQISEDSPVLPDSNR
jgi:hypothetical protein